MGAAVAFAERMDGVEFGQEVGNLRGKGVGMQFVQQVGVAQIAESFLELATDVFRLAEPVAALADADAPDLACPGIDVLEQMAMDGKIVVGVKISGRQRLVEAGEGERQLGFVKVSLVLQVEQIAQDCCPWIAQRIGLGGVDQLRLLLADLFLDEREPLIK